MLFKRIVAAVAALSLAMPVGATPDKPLVIVSGQQRQLPSGDTLSTPDGIDLGTGTDTTVTRSAAGDLAIEGNVVYRAGGTDVAVADGGTGASTASGARSSLGLVIGTDVQAYNANLTTFAGITPSANVQTLLGAATFSAFRTSLGVAIGTDVEAHDADLTAIAALSGTSGFIKKTAANTYTLDTSTYLTGNQTITLTGDTTGSGATSIATTTSKINGTSLAGLATGILKNTTGTGVPSIAVAGDFPTLNQNTTGSAATLTTGRTIGMTGDVVWTSGSFNGSANVTGTSTIQAGAVTLADMANVATGTVFYRKTAGAGAPEVQTLATLKSDLGLTGTNSGDQTISITGDVTASGSTGALTATVTKINGTSLAGLATGILKNTTTTGVPSIAVAADFPTLNQNTTGSAATLTTGRTIGMTGDVTWTSGSFNGSANVTGTSSIGVNVVTNAMLAQVATATFKGRTTAATGNVEYLTPTHATALLNTFTSTLKGLVPASGGGTTTYLRADGTWTAPTASAAWGSITGTLSAQTDLNTALSAKLAAASNLSDLGSVSTARTNLGLGTAATVNTGTSGAAIPLLNAANTWGADQTFNGLTKWENNGAATTPTNFNAKVLIDDNDATHSALYLYPDATTFGSGGDPTIYFGTSTQHVQMRFGYVDAMYGVPSFVTTDAFTHGYSAASSANIGLQTGTTNVVIASSGPSASIVFAGSGTYGTNTTRMTLDTTTGNLAVTGAGSFTGGIGSTTATTQAAGDSSTKVATTAFVTTANNLKAPLANPVFTGTVFWQQGAPPNKSASTTLTGAEVLGGIVTTSGTSAVALTWPTGTNLDSAITTQIGAALATDRAFEMYVIDTGTSSGAVTMTANTGVTNVGNAVCAINATCHWLLRKTATNTFVAYRLGS